MAPSGDPWRRVQLGCLLLVATILVGTGGYLLLGLSPLDARSRLDVLLQSGQKFDTFDVGMKLIFAR